MRPLTFTLLAFGLLSIMCCNRSVDNTSSQTQTRTREDIAKTDTHLKPYEGDYAKEAIKVLEDKTIIHGFSGINSLTDDPKHSFYVEGSFFQTRSHPRNNVYYEIQALRSDQGKSIKRLIIWRDEDSTFTKEFEYEASFAAKLSVDTSELGIRRAQWMKLCNAHQLRELVYDLYSEDIVYFNHKPLVIGRADLLDEYNYMSRPDYNLQLTPLTVEIVNDSTVFEIGQCSGSYKGKYVLIWQREEDGIWRIIIDANV